ncbi:MAG: caspase family protein [Thermodesulfobacteriota bacterium]
MILNSKYNSSWGLIIGINEYSSVSPLSYARNDAEAVARLLIDKFDFPKENVTVILDEKATKEAIMSSFLNFANENTDPDDRLFVFFAGHGHTQGGSRGEVGFLVPSNGSIEDLSTLIRWDDLTRNAELIQAKHIFFVMDACYGGLAVTRSLGPGSMRFLKDMLRRFSRQVLTAGKADETVSDSGGPLPGHSIFTGHLLKAFEGEAVSSEGIITANGIMSYVYEKVSKDHHSHQTPHYGYVEGDGDFIFRAPTLSSLETEVTTDSDVLVEIPTTSASVSPNTGLDIINQTKEFISDTRYRIKLDDLVTQEIKKVKSLTTEEDFPVQTEDVTVEDFFDRIKKYESAIHNLQSIVVCLAHWGGPEYISILRKPIARVPEYVGSDSGKVAWLGLRLYPTVIMMYSGGIGAIAADNYQNLAALLMTPTGARYRGEENKEVIFPVVEALTDLDRTGFFKRLPGYEKFYVPRSEYLFKQLQPTMDDLLFLGKSYEEMFDRFEVFLALVYADMAKESRRDLWGPFGRFAWKYESERYHSTNPFSKILEEANSAKDDWPPLKAGFFDGSHERFHGISGGYEKLLQRVR